MESAGILIGGQAVEQHAVGVLDERRVGPLAGEQGALLGDGGVLVGIAGEVDAGLGRLVGNMPCVGPVGLAVCVGMRHHRHQTGTHFVGGGRLAA